MDTTQYYGPYTEAEPTSTAVPQPNVPADVVPGCNILNQFSIANYTGPIPCETNTSAPCQVWHLIQKHNIAYLQCNGRSLPGSHAEHDRQGCLHHWGFNRHWQGCCQPICSCWCYSCWHLKMPWRYPAPPNWWALDTLLGLMHCTQHAHMSFDQL